MAEGEALTWRELLEKHHSALLDEMGPRLDADVRRAAEQAAGVTRAEADLRIAAARQLASAQARTAAADSLHQALRRLRQSSGHNQILKVLNEISSPWAAQSVVLVFENHQARALALRGVAPTELVCDIAAAPAVVTAIETRDPVIALLSARELSEPLAEALGVEPGSRAHLFPVLVRQAVVAVVVTAGVVSTAQMELLCDAAGMRLEASAAPAAAALVQIAPAQTAAAVAEKAAWEDLSADEQRLHLQAQRMARVRTAEIRLYQAEALRRGTTSGDIYGALRPEIDAARSEFLQAYLSKSSTMVDYLHLEVLRTLAGDDDRLLGPQYPGPMV